MTPKTVKTVNVDGLAETLGLLGSPTRFRLLALLNGERSVGEVSRELGLSVSGTSQHLAKLKAYGLVTPVRDDQVIHYSRNDPKIRAALETALVLLGD